MVDINIEAARQKIGERGFLEIELPPDLDCDGRHMTDHAGRHAPGIERHIAEVFDHQPIDAAGGEGVGVAQGGFADGAEITAIAGGTGERQEMDHADHRLGNR